jgi:hypothetical protein
VLAAAAAVEAVAVAVVGLGASSSGGGGGGSRAGALTFPRLFTRGGSADQRARRNARAGAVTAVGTCAVNETACQLRWAIVAAEV